MYNDIREYIATAIKLVEIVNSVTGNLLTVNESWTHDRIEFYVNAHSTYISRANDFEIRMGRTKWQRSFTTVQFIEPDSFFTMILLPDNHLSNTFYSNPYDIPEEELFQKNTVYSDLELCHYYIQEYVFNNSHFSYNILMSSYDFTDLGTEVQKMQIAIESFELALTELRK